MLTAELMRSIKMSPRPLSQQLVAKGIIGPAFKLPFRKVDVVVEGLDRIPAGGRVYIAMNHTDRYQNFPFQFEMMKRRGMYAATWAKGKYYHRPLHRNFLLATANIPTPSKGYVITVDSVNVLGRPLSHELYRIVRDAFDAGHHAVEDHDHLRELAAEAGVLDELQPLLSTARDVLGHPFDPARETYLATLAAAFGELIEAFVDLNLRAFDVGLKIIVYPEGTRSRHLSEGKPGLAQMAVRTGATIVPVGCSGTDVLYPGHNPFARAGQCVYRVGEPLTPEGRLKEYQIDEPYRPFTRDSHRFDDRFAAVTKLVMAEIDNLVDPEYRADAGPPTGKRDEDRFVY
jgi:hypothetical protein